MPTKPRAVLTPDRIASEALALVDQDGLESLSMRSLGKRLGVEAMALYHHFPSKGHLLDAIAERLLFELVLPGTGSPVERIRTGLRNYRALAIAHPRAFVLLTTRRYSTPRSLVVLERILEPFAAAGFDPVMSARLFRLSADFVGGAGHAEIASRGAQDAPTPIVLEEEVPPYLPNLRRVAPQLRLSKVDAIFEFGLAQIMEIIERAPRSARKR